MLIRSHRLCLVISLLLPLIIALKPAVAQLDTTGWTVFTPSADTRTIYVSSSTGNDANNGLTAATAKATFNAAFTVFTNGSWTAGDQLMLAGGTAGGSYTDTTSSSLTPSHTRLSK